MPIQTPSEPKVYTSVYSNFKGVDFTTDATKVFKRRSPDALNMLPDDGGVPYKRTGWKVEYNPLDAEQKAKIREMWSFDYGGQSHILYAKGNGIYNGLGDNTMALITLSDPASDVVGFFFNAISGGAFYILADNVLREYTFKTVGDAKQFYFKEVQPYVPTVLIGRTASGGGTVYENVNLLTRKRKEMFLGDATSKEFYTSTPIVSGTETVKVKNSSGDYVTLTKGSGYTVDYVTGKITFPSAKPPVVTGEDNILVEYTATGTSPAAEQLRQCTVASVYNSRIFLSGASGTYKSYVWYSAYEDATYFPDLSYFVVGDDFTSVMGLIDLGEYLGIVKESNPESSTIFLAYSLTFDENSTYAVRQSITGVGAISEKSFNSLNGEQVFLSEDGLYGISAVMSSENGNYFATATVQNRSYYVNKKLLAEANLKDSVSVVWDRFYILCVNDHCYIMDGTQKNSWETQRSNLQYECYYWENVPATAFCVHNEELWFGTADGKLCRFKSIAEFGSEAFNDDGMPIESHWTTILDNDGVTHYFKNMQKKGCLVTIQSMDRSIANTSAEVYIRADENKPVYIGAIAGTNTDLPQDFYIKKKFKKYKRLQFIIQNDLLNESFGVQEVVKLYTIGNYSKNRINNEVETYTLLMDRDSNLYVSGHDVDSLNLIYESDTGFLFYEE